MNKHSTHKRMLVIGGSRDMGPAIAKRLALEGSGVALIQISKSDQANETVTVVQSPGIKAIPIQAYNSDINAVVAAIEQTVKELGGLIFWSIMPVLR